MLAIVHYLRMWRQFVVRTDNVTMSEGVSKKKKSLVALAKHTHTTESKKQNNASPSNQNRPLVCYPIIYTKINKEMNFFVVNVF